MTPRNSPPAAVDLAWQLMVWLDGHLVHLPAHTRAALGARALDAAVDLLDALLVAAYAPRASDDHARALRTANQRVSLLRFLLRGLRDRKHLSLDQHAYAAERLDTIGRMTGAWRRSPT